MLLFFRDEPIGRVLEAIEESSGVKVVGKEHLPADLRVNVRWTDRVALKEILGRLARQYHLHYEVPDPGTLVVSVSRD